MAEDESFVQAADKWRFQMRKLILIAAIAFISTTPCYANLILAVTVASPAATELQKETAPPAADLPKAAPPVTTDLPKETAPATTELQKETAPAATELPKETSPAASDLATPNAPAVTDLQKPVPEVRRATVAKPQSNPRPRRHVSRGAAPSFRGFSASFGGYSAPVGGFYHHCR
jgi:hypothetical protein